MQLNRLCVYHSPRDDLEQMRLQLKKALLEEILKVETGNTPYKDSLKEVNLLLKSKPKGYMCVLIGCRFVSNRHRQYVKHIKTTHPRVSNVCCNFKHTCVRNFSNIEDLISHIKEDHAVQPAEVGTSLPSNPVLDVPCRCIMSSCGTRHFACLPDLLRHFNTVHHKEARECVFEGCNHKFVPSSTSRNHFQLKHLVKGKKQLKSKHLLNVPCPPVLNVTSLMDIEDEIDVDEPVQHDNDSYDAFDIDDLENDEPDDESEEFFLQYYADFLNRLGYHRYIPQSTVQDIAEEYYKNSKRSQEIREKKLRESLRDVSSLSEDDRNKIVRDVIEDDFFLKAQEELNTQYKRNKYLTRNMQYVAPVEILLNKSEVEKGKRKDVLHYVPLEAAMKNLLEDRSFIQMFRREKNRQRSTTEDGKISDIQDGMLMKTNLFFQQNPGAMAFLFYSDGVELVNPLGAARGTYKVVQVFYTLVNIPKNQRSQIDKLQLAMIFKEKLLKKYPYEVIYKKMVEDLLKLEVGIVVNIPEPTTFKVGILLHSADNLEAHLLGGFNGSFSSKSVCRWCHIQYDQLEDNIHDFDGEHPHEKWTAAEYDTVALALERHESIEEVDNVIEIDDRADDDACELDEEDDYEDDDEDTDDGEEEDLPGVINEKGGIKSLCPLNVLQSFHCVNGFPPGMYNSVKTLNGANKSDLVYLLRSFIIYIPPVLKYFQSSFRMYCQIISRSDNLENT